MAVRTWLVALLGAAAGCGQVGDSGLGGGQNMSTAGSASDGASNLLGTVELSVRAGQGVAGMVGGDGPGAVLDGWSVSYTKVLVTFGEATFRVGGRTFTEAKPVVVDLVTLAEAEPLTSFTAYRSPEGFGFTMPEADKEFVGLGGVDELDVEAMVAGGHSIYIEGAIERADGQSCAPGDPKDCAPATRVSFAWGLAAGAAYAECGAIATVADQSVPVELVLPADAWLRTDLVTRGDVILRAQWIADADLDRDGETTLDELAAIKASALLPTELGYDLSGAPETIDTALDFLTAQARRVGRDGWGECALLAGQ